MKPIIKFKTKYTCFVKLQNAAVWEYVISVTGIKDHNPNFYLPPMKLSKMECGQLTKAIDMLLNQGERITGMSTKGGGGGETKYEFNDGVFRFFVNEQIVLELDHGWVQTPELRVEAPTLRRFKRACGDIYKLQLPKPKPAWRFWELFGKDRR